MALIRWLCMLGLMSYTTAFRSLTTCNCLTQNVTYECTASGGAFTVWNGNAFMCQGGEIALRHVGFLNAIGECNSGAVIARGVKVTNNLYTSQLSIRLNQDLLGRTVICSLDSDQSSSLIAIGSSNLTLSTNSFPPPGKIYIEHIRPDQISFSWSSVADRDGCPSFYYSISTTNCGVCSPTKTQTSNTSTCTNFSTTPLSANVDVEPCNFTVQSVICGNISGDVSYHLVNLAVPDAPIILSIRPYYFFGIASLIKVEINFQVSTSFNISNEEDQVIDGSATSYTIIYAEFESGRICKSATITPSSCEGGACKHTFEVSASSCPSTSNITATVYSSNLLGNGSVSNPIVTGGSNTFVDVRFDPTIRAIACSFLNLSTSAESKSCIINITYGSDCDQYLGVYDAVGEESSLSTPAIEFINDVSSYCVSISASYGAKTVIVEGNLDLVNTGQETQSAATVPSLVVVIVIITLSAIATSAIIGLTIYFKHKPLRIVKIEASSLIDVLQVFKTHGVRVLGINTVHLHHAGITLETRPGFIDNYIFCICSEIEKAQLMKELNNIEFFKESATNEDVSALLKHTVKVSVDANQVAQSLWETLNVFKRKNIKVVGVNTPNGEGISVLCKCSKQEEIIILKEIGAVASVSKYLRSPKQTMRRIEFLVRPETSDIVKALQVFADCGINIEDINPDYIQPAATDVNQFQILKQHYDLVECICKEETRKELLADLKSKDALNPRWLYDKDLPTQNDLNQDYCVVAFYIILRGVGSFVKALAAFQDLNIRILGINTLGCADHSTLQRLVNYKRCKLEFVLPKDKQQKELIKEIQATGIVVESDSLLSERAVAKTASQTLQVLIEPEMIGGGMPEALQIVLKEFEASVTGYEMDRDFTFERQLQHYHVTYSIKPEEHQVQSKLIKELKATGVVKILCDFSVDDDKSKTNSFIQVTSCV